MNPGRRERLLEELEEAQIKLLMDEYAEAEGVLLLQEFERDKGNGSLPVISPELDQKCQKLISDAFAASSKGRSTQKILHLISKVAACFLIIIGFGAALVMSVEAFRIPVINYFMEIKPNYSAFSFDPDDTITDIHQSITEQLKCIPVPEDYERIHLGEDEKGVISCCFSNANQNVIIVEIIPTEGKAYVDTEDANSVEFMLNEHVAIFWEKDNYRISWVDAEKGVNYNLVADALTKEAIIKIANYLSE